MKSKKYEKPAMKAVEIDTRNTLLTGSMEVKNYELGEEIDFDNY